MVYHSVCDVSKSQKLRMHALCTPSLRLNAIKAEEEGGGFPLNPKRWGRNESFPNHVLFALGMSRGADATLTNLFNLTSGRDASRPCLISTWSKKGYTIVYVIKTLRIRPAPRAANFEEDNT